MEIAGHLVRKRQRPCRMTVLRGTGHGLEVRLTGADLDGALAELEVRLAEQPEFYRGTGANVILGTSEPTAEQMERLHALLDERGIVLKATVRVAEPAEELTRRRAMRPRRHAQLSDAARSLVADFAGARSDIAARRRRGESSVPRLPVKAAPAAQPLKIAPLEASPTTNYHVGTLRGGQSLQHVGNVVVVGDVNPGAEIVASGDIVVFGSLRGVAHAGAQGDTAARVYALELAPTQLRIATCIAADHGEAARARPEIAFVRDERIATAALGEATP